MMPKNLIWIFFLQLNPTIRGFCWCQVCFICLIIFILMMMMIVMMMKMIMIMMMIVMTVMMMMMIDAWLGSLYPMTVPYWLVTSGTSSSGRFLLKWRWWWWWWWWWWWCHYWWWWWYIYNDGVSVCLYVTFLPKLLSLSLHPTCTWQRHQLKAFYYIECQLSWGWWLTVKC